jgi:hypothetical protein
MVVRSRWVRHGQGAFGKPLCDVIPGYIRRATSSPAVTDEQPLKRASPIGREQNVTERRQAKIDGRAVSYLRAGSGPPVVLLHGIGGNAAQWRAQLTGLADEFSLVA